MSFKDFYIKTEYRTLIDKVIQNFYLPLLNDAKVYKRAVGFFSSSSLVEISKGIAMLAAKGGKIQIVASPKLSEEDIEAINTGYKNREEIIEKALIGQLSDDHEDYYSMERLNLLANLIADGVLDIRIAFIEDDKGIGIYHEKMGIIEDEIGNKVAFSGSMNESLTAMSLNYEAIDVFCNWKSESDRERVIQKENAFCSIWNNNEPNICVQEFPEVSKAIIEKYRIRDIDYGIDVKQFGEVKQPSNECDLKNRVIKGARIPRDISLYDYQIDAINNWVGENYRGIFDMATGTGKTLTGLGALSKLSEDMNDELAVIIVCPFQHLVEQWVEDIVKFNIKPIIGYSSSAQKDWKRRLSKAVFKQKIRQDKSFFCFITTNATFASDFVQQELRKIKKSILLIVDEAHNFGASSLKILLDEKFNYRLALSATLERHYDEEGTSVLYKFFGKKCIEYDLQRAIDEGKLTPYKYYPIIVTLTESELQEYDKLSVQISRNLIKTKSGKLKLNPYGEILAIKRSRIIAGAINKLECLKENILPYINENLILVYCGATSINDPENDLSETNSEDIRQIDAVTRLLGNELGMRVARFTSREDMSERALLKEHFKNGDDLQALVAIKCLDEGVNIPSIKTAFILASTTNPKEYIQRRGRVLRKSKETGKEFAVIYDFVTLPRFLEDVSGLTEDQLKRELTLVKNEVTRIEEFGRLAMNPEDYLDILWDIKDAYKIKDDLSEGDFYGY